MSNRRKTAQQRREQTLRRPTPMSAPADPATSDIIGEPHETSDMIEHAEDCEGLLEFSAIEDPYEVWECTRCGPVWFFIDGDEVSRGEPPEGRA